MQYFIIKNIINVKIQKNVKAFCMEIYDKWNEIKKILKLKIENLLSKWERFIGWELVVFDKEKVKFKGNNTNLIEQSDENGSNKGKSESKYKNK